MERAEWLLLMNTPRDVGRSAAQKSSCLAENKECVLRLEYLERERLPQETGALFY